MPVKLLPKKRDAVVAHIRASRGLPAQIARACGVTTQAIYQWRSVPPQWVMTVAPLIGMKPSEIRPDIFRAVKKRA